MAKLNAPRNVTTSTTASLLSDGNRVWAKRIFRNQDVTISVFLGDITVTNSGATKGFELKAGEIFTDFHTSDPVYVVSASGAPVVTAWEFGQ